MAMIRRGAFIAWLTLVTLVVGLIGLPVLLTPRSTARALVRGWLSLVLGGARVFAGVSWETRGTEHLPTSGALVASKHQSLFETFALWRVLDDPAVILKEELGRLPIFGWYSRKMENIEVTRSAGARALRAMTQIAAQKIDDGRQVLIFPEGTRTRPNSPPEYKPGIFAIYRAAGRPVTPVAINSGLVWASGLAPTRTGHITIEFLPKIAAGLDRAQFMATLQDRIESATTRLLAEARGERA